MRSVNAHIVHGGERHIIHRPLARSTRAFGYLRIHTEFPPTPTEFGISAKGIRSSQGLPFPRIHERVRERTS